MSITDRQAAQMLEELADQTYVGAAPIDQILTSRRPRRAFPVLACAAAVAMIAAASFAIGSWNESSTQPPQIAGADPEPIEVGRGGLQLPVPTGLQLVESTSCDGEGVRGDAVIVTDGAIGPCVLNHSGELRVYLTGLSDPPFGKDWIEVTDPAGAIGGFEIRTLSPHAPLVSPNATYVTALVAPSEDFVLVVAGPVMPQDTQQILDSVHAG